MKQDLLREFLFYAVEHQLFSRGDHILAAVSGGPDSMAMADLLLRSQAEVTIAHVNFGLRGDESDQDEEFVRSYFEKSGIPVLTNRFNTLDYASEKGISIEMAARELRYDWFRELCSQIPCSHLAVGHHQGDSIETGLINLVRGTGLRGLTGIAPKRGTLIRPLLFTDRPAILQYLEWRNIPYRIDSTNKETDILRNRIRHEWLPLLESVNPSFREVFLRQQEYFGQVMELSDNRVDQFRREHTSMDKGCFRIPVEPLLELPGSGAILYELLSPFGFRGDQVRKIYSRMSGQPGKQFLTHTHRLLIDRGAILIEPLQPEEDQRLYPDPSDPNSQLESGLEFRIEQTGPFTPPDDPGTAWLDYDKLEFPLLMRKWKPGDFFYPLGMNQAKKVSDFLIDIKVDRIAKSSVQVLLSGDSIVWVVGKRIDHRYRITKSTSKALIIKSI